MFTKMKEKRAERSRMEAEQEAERKRLRVETAIMDGYKDDIRDAVTPPERNPEQANAHALHQKLQMLADNNQWTNGDIQIRGASLVETRVKGGAAFASTTVRVAGLPLRFGGAVPIKREEMTVIDSNGVLTLAPDAATFVGGKHSRKWEYRKITGIVTDSANELLIGVENRQKMSGVRYPQEYDAIIDAMIELKVAMFDLGGFREFMDWTMQCAQDYLEQVRAFQAALDLPEITHLAREKYGTAVVEAWLDEFGCTVPAGYAWQ
jgi:hypothetical protein